MTIFSEIVRTFHEGKPYGEPDFSYLDRSARPEAARVRAALESWLLRYPAADIPNMVARLRNGSDAEFASATFEIYLHEILLRLGFEVDVHPPVMNGKQTKPDFLVTPVGEGPFYLEAVLATGDSAGDQGANARLDTVLEALNSMSGSDFYLSISHVEAPDKPVPTTKMVRQLQAWLATLDPAAVDAQLAESGADLPTFTFRHGEWWLEFTAFPKPAHRRGDSASRNIGGITTTVQTVDSWTSIRNAVRKKASRYGELEHPYVVGINAGAFHVGRIDVMQGLFGQETFDLSGPEPKMLRAANGAWYGPKGPQNRRVSAVLIVAGWSTWHAATRDVSVYHNPWANRPIGGRLDRLPHARMSNNKMHWFDGLHPRSLLGLSEDWPESSTHDT